MRASKKVSMLFMLLLGLALVAGGCSSSSSSDSATTTTTTKTTTDTTTTTTKGSSVHLTGSVGSTGTGVSSFFNTRFGVAPPPAATAVWAIPIAKMQGANIDKTNVMLRKTTTPDASGNFSFDLTKSITFAEIKAQYPGIKDDGMLADAVFEVDWLLVRMDGNTPLNVIQLASDATYSSMLTLPLSAFTPTALDIGTVSAGGVAAYTVSTIANDVTLSSSSIKVISRSDKVLSTITDVIRNCDMNNNKCVSANQSHVFMGDYSQILSTYATTTSYSGYQLYFDLTDYFTSADFDKICTNGTSSWDGMYTQTTLTSTLEYKLTPPSPPIWLGTGPTSTTYLALGTGPVGSVVTRSTNTQNEGTKTYIDCFDRTSSGSPFSMLYQLYLRKNVNNVNDWHLQFITGDDESQLTKDTSPGNWILTRDTGTGPAPIGTFEFALASPVDDAGHPVVFVPAIKIDTVADGPDTKVTTLHIKWYQWDTAASAYVEITDYALLDSLAGGFGLAVEDFNGKAGDTNRRAVHFNGQAFSTTSFDISNPSDIKGPFYYNYTDVANTKFALGYVGINYQFGGQSFRFVWRMPF